MYKKLRSITGAGHSDKAAIDLMRNARYRVVNPYGFVGYQVGEAALQSGGYYTPKLVNGVEELYRYWEDPSIFKDEKTESLVEGVDKDANYAGRSLILTSWNKWEGTFTGKDGIESFEDLLIPEKQDLVARTLMRFNLRTVVNQYKTRKGIANDREAMQHMLATQIHRPEKHPNKNDPETLPTTVSGILAAAHLIGPWGIGNLLADDGKSAHADETGTTAYDYFLLFNNYETNFDTPGDDTFDIIPGVPEIVTTGWGNDSINIDHSSLALIGPSKGVDIQLHDDSHGITTITGYRPNSDRLTFRIYLKFTKAGDKTVLDGSSSSYRSVNGEPTGLKSESIGSDISYTLQSGQRIIFKNALKSYSEQQIRSTLRVQIGYPLSWGGEFSSGETIELDPKQFNVQGGDFFYPADGINGLDFAHIAILKSNHQAIGVIEADGHPVYIYDSGTGENLIRWDKSTIDNFENIGGTLTQIR